MGIIIYEYTCHSSNIKAHEIVCTPAVDCCNWFDIGSSYKDPKLVYSSSIEMNQQQTCRGPSFYVGWIYDNTLSPSLHLGWLCQCECVGRRCSSWGEYNSCLWVVFVWYFFIVIEKLGGREGGDHNECPINRNHITPIYSKFGIYIQNCFPYYLAFSYVWSTHLFQSKVECSKSTTWTSSAY